MLGACREDEVEWGGPRAPLARAVVTMVKSEMLVRALKEYLLASVGERELWRKVAFQKCFSKKN